MGPALLHAPLLNNGNNSNNGTMVRSPVHPGGYSCVGNTFDDYETYTGCVGGSPACGGEEFSYHHYSQPIQTIRAWTGGADNGLKAIQIQTFQDIHGQSFTDTIGKIPANNPDAEITLSPGELISVSIELCGNGIGTRTGHISFKTSKDQTFSVGDTHTPYYQDADGTMISGMFGRAGDDVNALAFYLVKSVDHLQIEKVNYPDLDSRTTPGHPSPTVFRFNGCNDGYTGTLEVDKTTSITTGEKSTWGVAATMSLEIGESATVEAGIPEVGKASATAEWKFKVSATASYSRETSTVKTESITFKMPLEPRTKGVTKCSWFDTKIDDLKYTGDLVMYFKDQTSWTQSFTNTYQGVYTTDADCTRHVENLAKNESCQTLLPLAPPAVSDS